MTRPTERLWTVGFTSACLALVAAFTGWSMFVVLPAYLADLGGSGAQIGLVVGSVHVVRAVTGPVIGRWADVRGPWAPFLLGVLCTGTASAAYPSVSAFGPALVGVRLVHGLGGALVFSALDARIGHLLPATRRSEGLALWTACSLVAAPAGAAAAEALIAARGYDLVFGAATAMCGAALVAGAPMAWAGGAERGAGGASGALPGDLWALLCVVAVYAGGSSAPGLLLSTFVREQSFGSVTAFLAVSTATSLAARLGLGWVPDRIGARRCLLGGFAAVATALAWLASTRSTLGFTSSAALYGAGTAFTFPQVYALIAERVPRTRTGSGFAALSAATTLGSVIGTTALGFAADHAGHRGALVFAAVAVSAAGLGSAVAAPVARPGRAP